MQVRQVGAACFPLLVRRPKHEGAPSRRGVAGTCRRHSNGGPADKTLTKSSLVQDHLACTVAVHDNRREGQKPNRLHVITGALA